MCEYCEEPTRNIKLHRHDTDSNIMECFIHKASDGAALFIRQDLVAKFADHKLNVKQMNEYVYVGINYCMFCGRKL